MSITHNSGGSITWSAASTKSVAATANATSDAFTFNTADFQAAISLHASNNGTAASGDTVDWWIEWTADGTNYDTPKNAQYLGRTDTFLESPAQIVVTLPSAAQGFKLYSVNNAATNGITISAAVETLRG